jgi:chitodextrinase
VSTKWTPDQDASQSSADPRRFVSLRLACAVVILIASGPTLAADTQPPTAPGSLTIIAASSSEIDLVWNASTDDVGVTGYRIERCQGAACSNFSEVAAPTVLRFDDPGRTPSTTYRYRVRAKDAANNFSSYSNIQTYATPASSPDCD